jgi:Ca2+/Na+ antiporter
MAQKAYVRATKPALIVGMIAMLAFLLFGIIFFVFLMKEGVVEGMIFMVFWIFVVVLIGGIFIYNLLNYNKNVESNVAEEIVIPDVTRVQETMKTVDDFDDKLRKLESLRREGIISEEEFKKKRAEIMERKW